MKLLGLTSALLKVCIESGIFWGTRRSRN